MKILSNCGFGSHRSKLIQSYSLSKLFLFNEKIFVLIISFSLICTLTIFLRQVIFVVFLLMQQVLPHWRWVLIVLTSGTLCGASGMDENTLKYVVFRNSVGGRAFVVIVIRRGFGSHQSSPLPIPFSKIILFSDHSGNIRLPNEFCLLSQFSSDLDLSFFFSYPIFEEMSSSSLCRQIYPQAITLSDIPRPLLCFSLHEHLLRVFPSSPGTKNPVQYPMQFFSCRLCRADRLLPQIAYIWIF